MLATNVSVDCCACQWSVPRTRADQLRIPHTAWTSIPCVAACAQIGDKNKVTDFSSDNSDFESSAFCIRKKKCVQSDGDGNYSNHFDLISFSILVMFANSFAAIRGAQNKQSTNILWLVPIRYCLVSVSVSVSAHACARMCSVTAWLKTIRSHW